MFLAAVSASDARRKEPLPDLPRNDETGAVEYQQVVDVDGASADELLSRARAWVAETYRSAQDVIQLDDPSAGRLIARGLTEYSVFTVAVYVRHRLTVEARDGRYRVTVTDFEVQSASGDSASLDPMGRPNRKAYEHVAEEIPLLLRSLEKAMAAKPDDW